MEEKRKRGGQPGNQNARGNRGNPHPNPPPIHQTHGAYRIPRRVMDIPVEEWRAMLPILREYEKKHGIQPHAKYREYVHIPVEEWAIIEEILIDYMEGEE